MSFVVVTGSAGLVGANLIRALLGQGQRVRALVHHNRQALEGLDVEEVMGDVRDPDSLRRAFAGAEVVYHAAAYISISMDDWTRLEAVNVSGTRNVVAACLQSGVRRLVHFSSIEALEPTPAGTVVDESRPLVSSRHYPPYARSKAAGEIEVRQGQARGLDAIVLYPTAIVGPNDYRLGFASTGLLALCNGGLPALVAGGFDWVDVRDVVAGAMQAAGRAPAGERYILSGHWASLREIATLATDIAGVRPPRLVAPMWLARLGAPFITTWSRLTGRPPLYTSAALTPLRKYRLISHDHASRDLEYRPRPLHDTILDTWQWFAANGLCGSRLSARGETSETA